MNRAAQAGRQPFRHGGATDWCDGGRFALFSVLIISSSPQLSAHNVIIFSLKVCRLNIREVRIGEVLGPIGREFIGWRDWVAKVGGWW